MTSQVTVLGLGPMGRALAGGFVAAGHETTVWNRTRGREGSLNVRVAVQAAHAIHASPLVVVCVADYEAVSAVADAEALRGRTLVNFSGGSPQQARAMADWASQHGITYLDAVIIATPDAIGTSAATFFYSGASAAFEQYRGTLAALGENMVYLGDQPGRAAAFDVALQDFFWTALSGVVHALAFGAAEELPPREVAEHAKAMLQFLPDMVDQLADHVQDGTFPGEPPLTSVAAILDHLLEAVRSQPVDDTVLTAVRAQVQQAIASGHGGDGLARLAAL